MSTPSITKQDGALHLRCAYRDREAARSIPSARWIPGQLVWRLSATAAVAKQAAERFPHARLCPEVSALIASAAGVADAQQARTQDADSLPVPHLHTRPWLHQRRAYHFAAAQPAAMLAMEMGTGKSLPTVALANGCERTLILCPARVISVWPAEFARHSARVVTVAAPRKGSTASRAREIARQMQLAAARKQPFIAVVNYESAWRDERAADGMGKLLLSTDWDLIALDESHRIKAPGGKASKFCARLAARARKRLCLTGTPAPHSPLDIWAQMRFLDVGVLGSSHHAFEAHYVERDLPRAGAPAWLSKQIKGYRNLDKLAALTGPYIFRVGKEVLDLPPVQHVRQPVDLEPRALAIYRQLDKELIAATQSGVVNAANAMVKLLRLQQLTGGAVKLENGDYEIVSTAKREVLAGMLEDMDASESVVVFCRFKQDLKAVSEVATLAGRRYLELSGTLDQLDEFQADSEPAVLGVQIQSGGVGVNLTKARYSVFYSLSYSLGEFEQALARCHRPGQTRPVTHYHLVCVDTTDEKIYRALECRREPIEELLDYWRQA